MGLKVTNRNHKLFGRFMISYLLILLITLLIGIYGYTAAFQIVEKDIEEASLSMLNQSKDVLEQKLSLINTAAIQIATNPRIIEMQNLSANDEAFSYFKLKLLVDELANYKLNLDRDSIYDYYIYLKKSNYIVNPETVYKADFYYEHALKSMGISYEDWTNKILNKFHSGEYFPDTMLETSSLAKYSVVMYMQSIPFDYGKNTESTVVVLINSKGINKLFSRINIASGGWIYIQDKEGNIITTISNNPETVKYIDINKFDNPEGFIRETIDDNDMIINYTISSLNGWRYVLALPSNVVMDKLNNFKKLIFNVFLISFILGTAIAYYLSYHNTKPLNNILKQIKDFMGEDETESREDAFNTINTTISSLISSNNSLQEKLKEQKPMILAAFIERLLKGEYNNRGEIEATSSYVGINFESSQYIVLVLRVYGRNDFNNINEEIVQELNTVKIILKEAIDRHLTNRGYYNDIDAQSIALILCIDKYDNYKHEIEITIQKIYKDLSERYSLKILFGIGNLCKSSLEIWRSYQEALEAVNCIPHHDQEISKWYLDIPKEGQIYYYPIEFEQRIINCCKSSDVEQIKILFDILYEENFMKRILTMSMYKQLFYELKSTMIKLAQQVSEDGSLLKQLEDLSFSKSINEDFQCIFKEYINICAYIAESKNNKSLCLIKKITSFIDENYMIKDLGLPLVASEFNFSEGYLSYFFKEQTGKNFSDYVEQIRMIKAHKLLESSTISINDIAEKVGYSNVQSFRRAFKRVEGVSPSMLRK